MHDINCHSPKGFSNTSSAPKSLAVRQLYRLVQMMSFGRDSRSLIAEQASGRFTSARQSSNIKSAGLKKEATSTTENPSAANAASDPAFNRSRLTRSSH